MPPPPSKNNVSANAGHPLKSSQTDASQQAALGEACKGYTYYRICIMSQLPLTETDAPGQPSETKNLLGIFFPKCPFTFCYL